MGVLISWLMLARKADIEDTRAFEGSGLGLSIAKAYAEMLGGKIWLESQEGKGSTFYFSIPNHTAQPELKIRFLKT